MAHILLLAIGPVVRIARRDRALERDSSPRPLISLTASCGDAHGDVDALTPEQRAGRQLAAAQRSSARVRLMRLSCAAE